MSARLKRIKDSVPLHKVLFDYGYQIDMSAGSRQQQFSCDLHGDGSDSRPSARMYPDTKQWYCFACGKSRDVVETVRDKENLSFRQAMRVLEQRFDLPVGSDDDWVGTVPDNAVAAILDANRSCQAMSRSLFALIESMTESRTVTGRRVASCWEAYDVIQSHLVSGRISEPDSVQVMVKVRNKVLEELANADRL